MKNKIRKIPVCLLFLLLIFGASLFTLRNSWRDLLNVVTQNGLSRTSLVNELESVLTQNVVRKDKFIELYGVSQKLMFRNLVGDNQFYQDKDNVMHLKREYLSGEKIADSIGLIASDLESKSIPFMVCQIAERAAYGNDLSRYIDEASLAYIDDVKDILKGTDVIYLDYMERLKEAGFDSEDIFFRTDVHYTTESEFYILKEIIDTLETEAGLVFGNKEIVFDLDNYAVEKYPFWGNLLDSVGKYYAGTDKFTYYIPKYETSMSLINPSSEVNRHGTFEEVCMNGYRDIYGATDRAYRVTDYMQWPSPYYCITNDLISTNDILVIGCSMSMRTNAYLSLLCRSVTVLDPRAFNEKDYLAAELEKDYDAVICYPSYNLLDGLGGYNAEILNYEVIFQENGTFALYADVKNTGTSAWTANDKIRMHLWLNDSDVGIRAELSPDEKIEPGSTYKFTMNNLPNVLLDRELTVQMLKEGRFYFGEKENIATVCTPDNMTLDADIVNNTTPAFVKHRQKCKIEITVRNTGKSAWSSQSQTSLCIWRDGTDHGYRLNIPDGTVIEPQEEYTFTLYDFSLSNEKQVYLEYQMVIEGTGHFGECEPALIKAS